MENIQENRISELLRLSFFTHPDEQKLREMAAVLQELELADGEQLFEIGDAGDALYIIRQGRIKIHDGDYVLDVLKPGQMLGEYALIDDKKRSASATSEGKTSLYQIRKKDFLDFAERYPGIKEGVLRLLTARLREKNILEEELARKNAELSRRQDEVEKQRDKISAQKNMKDKLLSIISHDLKGPFGALGALCSTMEALVQEEQYEDLLELVVSASQEVDSLVILLDNLLSYASQELSQVSYNPAMVNLAEIVGSLTLSLGLSARFKQIELKSEVPDDLEVWADRNSLEIIVRNLMDNALKFTPESGSITISAGSDADKIRLQVTDTGIGMSTDQVRNLFILDANSTFGTEGEKGVGLGLRIVSEFAKLNKGEVSAVSEENAGSTLTVTLPAKPEKH